MSRKCKHGVDPDTAVCGNCENERNCRAALRTRRCIAGLSHLFSRLFGHQYGMGCAGCGIPESVSPWHLVMLNETRGISVLCEGCWRDLSIEEKLRAYRRFYDQYWKDRDDLSWEQVERAIRFPFHWRNRPFPDLRISLEKQ